MIRLPDGLQVQAKPPRVSSQRLWVIHLACFVPMILVFGAQILAPSPDGLNKLILQTGEIAIDLLLLCLLITPIRELMSTPFFTPWRKIFGIWSFIWALVHVLLYTWSEATEYGDSFSFFLLLEDIISHPYLWYGAISFLLLIPLAVTSNRASQLALRAKWIRIHSSIYFIGSAAVVHLGLQIREDYGQTFAYLAGFIFLMSARVYAKASRRSSMMIKDI